MFESYPESECLVLAFIRCLKMTCLPALGAAGRGGTSHRAAVLVSRCLTGILQMCAQSPSYKGVQGEFVWLLVRVVGTARSRSCVSNTVEEYLHSAIFEIVHDERSFGELTKELQVRKSHGYA